MVGPEVTAFHWLGNKGKCYSSWHREDLNCILIFSKPIEWEILRSHPWPFPPLGFDEERGCKDIAFEIFPSFTLLPLKLVTRVRVNSHFNSSQFRKYAEIPILYNVEKMELEFSLLFELTGSPRNDWSHGSSESQVINHKVANFKGEKYIWLNAVLSFHTI